MRHALLVGLLALPSLAPKADAAAPALRARIAPPPKLLHAIGRAPRFLVHGNMPHAFAVGPGKEVDPGSTAHVGIDGRGRRVWIVDQKVRFARAPKDLVGAFLDGFFTGKAAGKDGKDLSARLVSVQRGGQWSMAGAEDNTPIALARSPFADPSIEAVVVHVGNVRPLGRKPGLRAGAMDMYIDMKSVVRGRDHAEFTVHFLNPDERQGPVPGTTDGAVRFRARRYEDGSATVEGYYITGAAQEYADPLSDFATPVATAKGAMKLGMKMWSWTPMGKLTQPVQELTLKAMTHVADRAIDATGAVQHAVAALHARYYREVLFPNLMRP